MEIRGVEVPDKCEVCVLADTKRGGCRATGWYYIREKGEDKPKWCPIVEESEE